MKSVVVLPTYNEIDNLELVTAKILQMGDFDVLIVDDNSPDGTGQLADQLSLKHPGRVQVLHRPTKEGLGPAYLAGFSQALKEGYDYVFQMDADLSHDPSYLPELKAGLGASDVVLGSRNVPGGKSVGWPLRRRVLSKGGSLYARLVLGLPVHDLTGGFKGFRRQALEMLDLDSIHSNGYSFQIEMTYRCHKNKLSIAEVPITFVDRRNGTSKMSGGIVKEAMFLVLKLRLAEVHWPLNYFRNLLAKVQMRRSSAHEG